MPRETDATTKHPEEPPEQPRLLLTMNDVCERLQLSRPFVHDLLNRGEIRSITLSVASDGRRMRRIPMQALEEFIARGLGSGPDAA